MSVHFTLLATFATMLLDGPDEVGLHRLGFENVVEWTVSRNHHLKAAGAEGGVCLVHEGSQKRALVNSVVLIKVLGHLGLLFLCEDWQLEIRRIVDITLTHCSCVPIGILVSANLSQKSIEFQVFNFLDVKIKIDLCVIRLQKFAKLHSVEPFLKGSLVVANLLSCLASHVGSVFGLR